MKKLFLSIMTASMFFVSCSNDETVVPENNGSENNVEDLVEIKLGAGSRIGSSVTESRAVTAVEKWDNEIIGVFALANGNQWDDSEETEKAVRNVLWHNISGTIKPTSPDSLTADITPQQAEKYYPRNDKSKKYTFYGYYPYANNDKVNYSTGKDSVFVTGEFTGQEDIMWGMTEKLQDGWNASYARETAQGTKPNLQFKHLMSWLVVNVVKGTDYETEKEACTISSLYVNHPSDYKLTVATDSYVHTDTAKIEWTGTKELSIYKAADNTQGFVINEQGVDKKVIDEIFMMPSKSITFHLQFKGEPTVNNIPLSLPAEGIQPGKKYNVNIIINGPKAIEITATLTPWTDGDEIGGEI